MLISLIVTLIIVGALLYCLELLTFIDPTIKQIIRVLVIVLALLYVLQAFGIWHTSAPLLR
jgi:hypothetical protein